MSPSRVLDHPTLCAILAISVAPLSGQVITPDSAFFGCYRVEYKTWGPSRIIGEPIGHDLPAPAVIVLTHQPAHPAVTRGAQNALGAKVLARPTDSRFHPAYWKPLARDSATIVVPFSVGLYGLTYEVRQESDSLAGLAQ